MSGRKALRKIQMGRESTAGTAVAATTIWRGPAQPADDQREIVFPAEDVGILGGTDRSYISHELVEIPFPETEATFEQFPHVLDASILEETPTQDGAGTGYGYVWALPTTSVPTIKTYTLEYGDDQQAEESAYCFCSEWTLKGSPKKGLMLESTWLGRTGATTTYTGALALPTVEEILFQKGSLYADDAGDSFGGSQLSNTFVGFELSYKSGWIPRFTGDNQLFFTAPRFSGEEYEVTLDITFEHDGSAVAEKANWRNETSRLIRMEFVGAALGTPGSESNKRLTIDLAGKWETFAAIDEEDGNDIVTATFRNRYNSTAATRGKITIVNELSALP